MRYTPRDYQNYLTFDSQSKHLLVEGRDDKHLFFVLLSAHFDNETRNRICIDSAQDLIDFDGVYENRDKIEQICREIQLEPYAENFAGFVDREFREFELIPCFQDNLKCHRVSGRLVWSRGHSVENYFLDYSYVEDVLVSHLPDIGNQMSDLLRRLLGEQFETLVRIACAMSLTGKETHRLGQIRESISVQILKIAESRVTIDLDSWKKSLAAKGIAAGDAEILVERFLYWSQKTATEDYSVTRWICDGHIGFALIWAAYERLTRDRSGLPPIQSDHRLRFNLCAGNWSERTVKAGAEYPAEVFQLLGLGANGG
jgi:hypothetical protein